MTDDPTTQQVVLVFIVPTEFGIKSTSYVFANGKCVDNLLTPHVLNSHSKAL